MPRLTLQPDNDRIWVTLDEQRIVSLRGGDCKGLKVITTWLVDARPSAPKKQRRCRV